MASYNFAKSADRARCRADRQAEVDAVDAGTWPRNIDDDYRWGANRYFHDVEQKAAYAKEMCVAEIGYIDGVEPRIKSGELSGWEI